MQVRMLLKKEVGRKDTLLVSRSVDWHLHRSGLWHTTALGGGSGVLWRTYLALRRFGPLVIHRGASAFSSGLARFGPWASAALGFAGGDSALGASVTVSARLVSALGCKLAWDETCRTMVWMARTAVHVRASRPFSARLESRWRVGSTVLERATHPGALITKVAVGVACWGVVGSIGVSEVATSPSAIRTELAWGRFSGVSEVAVFPIALRTELAWGRFSGLLGSGLLGRGLLGRVSEVAASPNALRTKLAWGSFSGRVSFSGLLGRVSEVAAFPIALRTKPAWDSPAWDSFSGLLGRVAEVAAFPIALRTKPAWDSLRRRLLGGGLGAWRTEGCVKEVKLGGGVCVHCC
jgi:hypothetical protein